MPQTKIILGLIVAFGLLLRVYLQGTVPSSLNWDEVSHGYNAYSILKTGKDEWGTSFPLIFRAFGDYKLPVYIYSTVLSEALFGLNMFAVRFPSLLAGIALIIFTFFLARNFFKNSTIALISAFLVAIEPWTFFLSRGAFEANFSMVLIVGGVYFFLEGFKSHKLLIVSAFLFGLSVWTYNSARVFVPLLFLSLIVIYKNQLAELWNKQNKSAFLSGLIILLFTIQMFFQLLRPEGYARFSNLTILNEGAIAAIEQTQNQNPEFRPFINRYTYFLFEFTKNWIKHFSPDFLFFTGGTHYQFSVPNHGILYLINLPFLLLGLALLLRKFKKHSFLFAWFLLAPIAGSLTRDVPHVLRFVVILPLPMIVTAYGLYRFFIIVKNRNKILFIAGIIIYVVTLTIFSASYLRNYFYIYPGQYSQAWQYGYKEVVSYAKSNYNKYDKIIITKKYGEPHEFLLFFMAWDPITYQSDKSAIKFNQSSWWWVDKFDKFYFINDWQVKNLKLESGGFIDCDKLRCLLITSPGNYTPQWKLLETISFLNGDKAFEILNNK